MKLNDKEESMSNVCGFRIYETELIRFSMEKQSCSRILLHQKKQAHLLPLNMKRTGEALFKGVTHCEV